MTCGEASSEIEIPAFQSCLGAIADSEFVEDVGDVVLNGARRDKEFSGDFFVAGPIRNKLQDFSFAFGKQFKFKLSGLRRSLRETRELNDDFARDRWLNERLAER